MKQTQTQGNNPKKLSNILELNHDQISQIQAQIKNFSIKIYNLPQLSEFEKVQQLIGFLISKNQKMINQKLQSAISNKNEEYKYLVKIEKIYQLATQDQIDQMLGSLKGFQGYYGALAAGMNLIPKFINYDKIPFGINEYDKIFQYNLIFHINAYKFNGNCNEDFLKKSIDLVYQNIEKFQYQLKDNKNLTFEWIKCEKPFENYFICEESESANLNEKFNEVCCNARDLAQKSNFPPMIIVLIKNKRHQQQQENEFLIVQINNHVWVDNKSSSIIFNKMCDYYNALAENNVQQQQIMQEQFAIMTQLSSNTIVNLIFKTQTKAIDHQKNLQELNQIQKFDEGKWTLNPSQQMHCFARNQLLTKQEQAPVFQSFTIFKIVQQLRAQNPDLTRNSIVCALITKVFWEMNIEEKKVENPNHKITFNLIFDILSEEYRHIFFGNYASMVPITVNGNETVLEIANSVNAQVKENKQKLKQVSSFIQLNDILEQGVVKEIVNKPTNQANDSQPSENQKEQQNNEENKQKQQQQQNPSFVIDNWQNFQFINNKNVLSQCTQVEQLAAMNFNTKLYYVMNQPIIIINFQPNGDLHITQPHLYHSKWREFKFSEKFKQFFKEIQ